jgi:LPS sulfotransferase NodH
MSGPTVYIVAATPRTGSSLLCEGLDATGIAGHPAEVFAPDFRYMWLEHLSLEPTVTFSDYLRATRRYGTTDNGVYGVKIQWMHIATLAQDMSFDGGAGDVLLALYPNARFINITRRDRRAQAISWYRAILTNEWWRHSGDCPRTQSETGLTLDKAFVALLEKDIARQQMAWEAYFHQHGVTPLLVEYEVLIERYREEVARALSFLDLDTAAARSIPSPRLMRQADELNSLWRAMLQADERKGESEVTA